MSTPHTYQVWIQIGFRFLTGIFHAMTIFTMFLLKLKHIPEVVKLFRTVSLLSEHLEETHKLSWKGLDRTSISFLKTETVFRYSNNFPAGITVTTVTENSI